MSIQRILVFCVLAWSAWGCGSPDEATQHYQVRGLVKELSGSGPERRTDIHHEKIAAFTDRDGKVAPMESMSMIFGLADDLPKDAFVVGDKLEIEFDMRWNKTPPLLITKVKKLAADTQLVLGGE